MSSISGADGGQKWYARADGSGLTDVDIVKDILLKKFLDDDKRVYVSHPDFRVLPRDSGESTYYIATYREPLKFSVDVLFRQAINLVGECVEDCDKYVFLITNRFQTLNNYQYRKGFLSSGIRNYPIKFFVFGVGDSYDNINLKSIADEYESFFIHLSNAAELAEKLPNLKEISGR